MEVYLGEDFVLSKPITGLNVLVNGAPLQETTVGTYTSDLGTDSIRAFQEYQLRFDYQGLPVSASTTVPPPITNLAIEPTYITASSYYYWDGDTTTVILSWDDPDHSFYQVYIESPTTGTTNTPGGGQVFGRRMVQPFQGNSYTLRSMELQTVGGYWIYLYRVNKEYVELYERISSTDLANPVSFIDNALGIFTSMSVARIRFQVFAAE
jgi:hypothetical protein